MIPVIAVNSSTGEMVGKVTCRNRCHGPAPSIAAASYRLIGTSSNAARKITMVLPMPHMARSVSDGLDQLGELNHSGPLSTPTSLSTWSTRPTCRA